MSVPAMKALVPEPVRITACTEASARSDSSSRDSSSLQAALRAFSLSGRLIVTVATRPAVLWRSVSNVIGGM